MPQLNKPGQPAPKPGEYQEVGQRGGSVANPRTVTMPRREPLPPTQKPNRRWEQK